VARQDLAGQEVDDVRGRPVEGAYERGAVLGAGE